MRSEGIDYEALALVGAERRAMRQHGGDEKDDRLDINEWAIRLMSLASGMPANSIGYPSTDEQAITQTIRVAATAIAAIESIRRQQRRKEQEYVRLVQEQERPSGADRRA